MKKQKLDAQMILDQVFDKITKQYVLLFETQDNND
jgi:hypothetical protein